MLRTIMTGALTLLVACTGPLTEPEPAGLELNRDQSAIVRTAIEEGENEIPLYTKTPVAKNEKGASDLLPPPQERTRIRIHIDQLKASINEVTGGINWVYGNNSSWWDKKKAELGVPDYMTSVIELREPTLLFVKLVGDAARDICPKVLASDVKKPAEDRVFLLVADPADTYESAPGNVKANLSKLVLKYHGRYFPPDDPRLQPWVNLFVSGTQAVADPTKVWTAVCVALMTHPDFMSY